VTGRGMVLVVVVILAALVVVGMMTVLVVASGSPTGEWRSVCEQAAPDTMGCGWGR
jgi:hypothetical protein